MKTSVSIRKIESYDLKELDAAIKCWLDGLRSAKINRSKRVLIKPNALAAYPPQRAVTTHPIVLEAVIRYFLALGKEVWLGDSPGGTGSFEQVFRTCGFSELAERYPIKLVNLSTSGYREVVVDGIPLKISELLWKCGVVISVSKYKTHSLMSFTGAVKNLYGLVPGLIKTEYHKLYPDTNSFAAMLAALHKAVQNKITYNIMDGIVGMDGAGPSAGKPKQFGLIFGSVSAPALDTVAASMMGFKISDVPYLPQILHDNAILPSRIGIPTSFRNYKLEDVDIRTVKLSKDLLVYVPGFAKNAFRKIYNVHPYVAENCKRCGVCVNNCPVKAISYKDDGYPVIDNAKCIKCMCCHELCPHQAIEIHKPWILRMAQRNR